MSTDNVARRRLLGLGAGVGAMALAAQRAEADVPFSSFAFAATGSPTARTMPDRLAEIKNVKDFGARGTGSTDDTAAIQAAVNWTSGANRGTVYFPVGTYAISAPITFETPNINIRFLGEPGATIQGNFADALIKRSVNSPLSGIHTIEKLRLLNSHASGKGIMAHSCTGVSIRDCYVSAWRGIETYNSSGSLVDTCAIIGPGGVNSNSIGIVAGNGTTVLSCDVTGYANGHGIRHHNVGLTVLGGRYEMNGIGIATGIDPDGAGFSSGGVKLSGFSMEANQTGIYLGPGAGSHVSGVSIGGGVQMETGINIDSGSHHGIYNCTISSSIGYKTAGVRIANNLIGVVCLGVLSIGTAGADSWSVGTGLTKTFIRGCNTANVGT